MTLKGSGESFAQIAAEKANPKLDVWFGGTGDPHLQAAEQGLLEEYKSPLLAQLQPWAQKQAEQSKYRTVGMYLGVLGIGYNTELLAQEEARGAGVLEGPGQARVRRRSADGESQCIGHGVHGDRHAGAGVRRGGGVQVPQGAAQEHQQLSRAPASAPIKAAARGETLASVSFIHDVVTEAQAGFPVKGVAPCEGTGYEIGSLSIVKGARNLDAREEVLRLGADRRRRRRSGAQAKQFQIPSNVGAPISPLSPKLADIKLINYDFAKYGTSAERKRLLERWDKEVGCIAKVARRHSDPLAHDPVRMMRTLVVVPSRCRGSPPAPRRAAQHVLQLAQHRVVPGHGGRLREGDGHQGRGRAEGDRRDARAGQGRARQSQGRRLVGGRRRHLPAGGRGRPARDLPLAERRSSSTTGRSASPSLEEPRRRRLRRHPRARLQHRDQAKKKLPVPKCWKDLLDPGATRTRSCWATRTPPGTAYLMLASLVQVFGEDEAFKYMEELNPNVS